MSEQYGNNSAPNTPTAVGEIPAEAEDLDKAIGFLHESLTHLESRLSPIIRSVPTSTANPNKEGSGTNVPFADRLRGLKRGVDGARDRVNTLLETIAL
jgi:hypothetical protein